MATDPLSLAFISCFLIGFLFLLITAFTGDGATHHMGDGGHMHSLHIGTPDGLAHHGGHSVVQAHHHTQVEHSEGFSFFTYLNPMSIALFLLGFGFLGYIFHNAVSSLAIQFTFAIAGVGGFILALLFLTLLSRFFGNSKGATVQDVSNRVGLLGRVSMPIPQNSIGEITYVSPGGMRKSIPARSLGGQRLERDQEVVVINYQNGVAEVDTWERFVNQEKIGSTGGSETDDFAAKQSFVEESDKTATEDVLRLESPKE